MTRTLFLLPAVLATACSVGEVDIGGGSGTPDSGGGTDDINICADKGTPGTAHNHAAANGNLAGARSGAGCMATGGCHGISPGSSVFAFAGTVYKEAAGTTPQPGVVVRIFPGNGMKSLAKAVTDDAGNFYIAGNFTAFPYKTDVTACGTDAVAGGIRPMVSPIVANDANCNAGGTCHAVPGGTNAVFLAD